MRVGDILKTFETARMFYIEKRRGALSDIGSRNLGYEGTGTK